MCQEGVGLAVLHTHTHTYSTGKTHPWSHTCVFAYVCVNVCVCVKEKGVCQQGVGRKECASKEERRGGGGHLFEVLFVFLRASDDQRASQL